MKSSFGLYFTSWPIPRPRLKVSITLFTKNAGQWLDVMAATGCDCLGVDWTTDLADARAAVGDKVALQGNMDPSILYGSDERIRQEVKTILDSYGQGNGHVFNLGHGILPTTPVLQGDARTSLGGLAPCS